MRGFVASTVERMPFGEYVPPPPNYAPAPPMYPAFDAWHWPVWPAPPDARVHYPAAERLEQAIRNAEVD